MQAEIITIGNELLVGQVVNKNATYISDHLTQAGVTVIQVTTIADDVAAIVAALSAAQQKDIDLIITTGGLGPTNDDLTRKALATYFSCPELANTQDSSTENDSPILKMAANGKHTLSCVPIANPVGTAAGLSCQKGEQVVMVLPGVPQEMQVMMQQTVIPTIRANFNLPAIYHTTICTIGIAEERLAKLLSSWEEHLPAHMQFAYLPDIGTVKLRLTTTATSEKQAQQTIAKEVSQMLPFIQEYVYGYDDDLIEVVIGKLLKAHNKSLAIAESCSGGYASQLVVEAPGSSAYYDGGIVAYNNRVKHEVLGIPADTLARYGAVSQEVALAMAQQVRLKFQSDIGLSSTGIAGPGGGDENHPVGTVWIAYADEHTSYAQQLHLTTHRSYNIQLTAYALLDLLRRRLQGKSS